MNYQERLQRVIPGGAHTYSRGADQFPANAPQILAKGQGAYVWDPDGGRYLDYGMALRTVTLGYAYPSVNEAAIKEIALGNNLTRASMTELRAAELITELIPSVDMVKFGKNGSNATTAAVKIARAYTGRRYVCVPKEHPFFSFDDWFIGKTPLTRGIPPENYAGTLQFEYGNIASLESLFGQHPDEVAAVMLEPATNVIPCPAKCVKGLTYEEPCSKCPNRPNNFLHQVQALCKKHGVLFVLDEMITGFRWHLQGAQAYFGVVPDLSTFGKAMANGFSVAAVGGRREVMEVGAIEPAGRERTFLLSTTHGGEMCGLGAFIETVNVYRERDVCRYLWAYGRKLQDGLNGLSRELGMERVFSVDGPPIALNYVVRDSVGNPSLVMRTLFSQEMIRHGVLMPWISVSLAHSETELDITLSAARKALNTLSKAIAHGVDNYLLGPPIKPVFRRYN